MAAKQNKAKPVGVTVGDSNKPVFIIGIVSVVILFFIGWQFFVDDTTPEEEYEQAISEDYERLKEQVENPVEVEDNADLDERISGLRSGLAQQSPIEQYGTYLTIAQIHIQQGDESAAIASLNSARALIDDSDPAFEGAREFVDGQLIELRGGDE